MSYTSLVAFLVFLAFINLPISILSSTSRMVLQGCPDKCGNIIVPYPFGIKDGCYRPGFSLTCDHSSSTSPQLFMNKHNIPILSIDLKAGEAKALKYISYICFNQTYSYNQNHSYNETLWMNLASSESPYLFSAKRNKFTVIGCDSLVYIAGQKEQSYFSGCLSFCSGLNNTTSGPCNGLGCCQTSIPQGLNYYGVQWGFPHHNYAWDFNPCTYAALMEEDSYNFTVDDLVGHNFINRNNGSVPFVLDWAIRDNGVCTISGVENVINPACLSNHSYCYNTINGDGYLCNCTTGYDGNPYILGGCQDINECEQLNVHHCPEICENTDGNYTCTCWKGERMDDKGNCNKIPDMFPKPARIAIVSILGVAIVVAVCILLDSFRQKRRYNKQKEEYDKYYKMMASSLSVFTEKEVQVATNNFDESRVIGTGGHGKVYMGLLEDNKRVAIKKSKKVEENGREEFVREITLLSQINHKNIVRILGCCLEVRIPMLVYEFIPDGSLFDLLHGKRSSQSISLATRLKVALGSAEALDYIHNSISHSILHGDVKSANILLADKNTAKVSDFGGSYLMPIDEAEVVMLAQWTPGYLDQESLSTWIIKQSSDVYSFGVVLVELITRKKAIYTDETNEKKSLAITFVSMANKNKTNEMLDKEIVNDDAKVIEILQEVSEIALWCLSGKGDDRPTMKQVVEKLQAIVRCNQEWLEQTDPEDDDQTKSLLHEPSFYTAPITYGFHSTESDSVIDFQVGTPR